MFNLHTWNLDLWCYWCFSFYLWVFDGRGDVVYKSEHLKEKKDDEIIRNIFITYDMQYYACLYNATNLLFQIRVGFSNEGPEKFPNPPAEKQTFTASSCVSDGV